MRHQSATDCHGCARCGAALVVLVGAGRTTEICGITVRATEALGVLSCPACGLGAPTVEQAEALLLQAERDLISDGGRGYRVVVRGL